MHCLVIGHCDIPILAILKYLNYGHWCPFFPFRVEGLIYTPSKLSNNSSGMNDISWYTRISSIYAGQYIKATPMRQSLLNWTSCLVIHMVNIYINKAIKPLPSSSFALSNNWGVGLIQGLALTSRLWNVPMQFFYFSSTRLAGHRPPVITKEFNLTVNSEQAAHVECRFSNVFVVPVTGEWAQVVGPVTDQCPPHHITVFCGKKN